MSPEKQIKVTNYSHMNRFARKGQILLAGSSLCEFFPAAEIAQHFGFEKTIYNRGVGGFTSAEMLEAIDECVLQLEPRTMFINIGTNDLSREAAPYSNLMANYREIIRITREKLPQVKIYMMSYYPVNLTADFGMPPEAKKGLFGIRTNAAIAEANGYVRRLAEETGCEYIDVNDGLTDENGDLRAEFAIEGMHMWATAYVQVFKNMLPYLEKA